MERTKSYQSKSTPGATFVLRKIGKPLRNQAELDLIDQRHEQRLLAQEQLSIVPEAATRDQEKIEAAVARLSEADKIRLEKIQVRSALLHEAVKTGYARVMLASFHIPENKEIADAEELIEVGPEDFVNEICEEAEALWSISAAEVKNSSRPSTSADQVDGPINDTTATPVKSEEITSSETAS